MAYDNRKQMVYIRDVEKFRDARERLRSLWYKKFGVALSKGDILLTALLFTLHELEKNKKEEGEEKSGLERYARLEDLL